MSAIAAAEAKERRPASTRASLIVVYAGYFFRYVYLLILIPFYGRVLGAGEYGRVLAAMSLYQVVWLLIEWGMPSAGGRDVAQNRSIAARAELYGTQMCGRLITAAVFVPLGLIAAHFSEALANPHEFGVCAVLMALISAFNLGWYFQGTLQFRKSIALELLGFAINLPAILLLVRGPQDGARILYVLIFSGCVSTAIAHFLVLRELHWRVSLLGRLAEGARFVRRNVPLFIHSGISLVLAGATTYLLSLYATPAEIGHYGAADRLVTVGLSLIAPANQVLIGTISSRLAEPQRRADAFRLMCRALLIAPSLGLLVALLTYAIAPFAIPLIFGGDFGASIALVRALIFVFPLALFTQVTTGWILVPLRCDRRVALISLVGTVVTTLAVLLLASAHSSAGAVAGRLAGYLVMTIVSAIVLRQLAAQGRLSA
ncbi:lipopolysaccharide biosynthesis protein [Derxia lacustris]|uniref:lipopolysaccharide biosynthesis protein n=1 Tax=Derxia lacustris TaxID=764842 RepID=UPI000A17703F|nr:oligosaccharide flippase family protein [Derxia lacustris]